MVAAEITPLMPGAGPPPTRIPNRPRFVPFDMVSFSVKKHRLLRQQFTHQRFLFLQLVLGCRNFATTEFVELNALHDFPLLAIAADRVTEKQSLLDAVAAVAANRNAGPIAG